MGYSITAGLPVYTGLYVTVFHCILYFLFGTSQHISPGTDAIISIMVYTMTNKYEGILFPSSVENRTLNATNPDFVSNDPMVARVMIASLLSLSSGILLVIILNLIFVLKVVFECILMFDRWFLHFFTLALLQNIYLMLLLADYLSEQFFMLSWVK